MQYVSVLEEIPINTLQPNELHTNDNRYGKLPMVANLLMARRETDASIKNMIHLFKIENIHSLLRGVSDILDRIKRNQMQVGS